MNCTIASSSECQNDVLTGKAIMNSNGSLNISGETVLIPEGVKLKLRSDETTFNVINCSGIYTLDI